MYDIQLSDSPLASWVLLRQTWLAMDRAAEIRLAKVGHIPEMVAALWICRDSPGLTTIAEIARLISRQSQSVVGLINRMEDEYLVTRSPKRKGRPFTEVNLTEKGEKACRAGLAVVRVLIGETVPLLSLEEREQLHKYLTVLRAHAAESIPWELTVPPDMPVPTPISVSW